MPWTAPAGCDGTPGASRPASGHPAGGLSRETPIPGTPRAGSGRAPSLRHPPCPFCSGGGGTGAPQTAATRAGAKLSGGHGAVRGRDLSHLQPGGPGPQHPPAGLAPPLGRPRPAPQRPRNAPGPGSSEEPLIGGRRDFYFKSPLQFFWVLEQQIPAAEGKRAGAAPSLGSVRK